MVCSCGCHSNGVEQNRWCPSCFDFHIPSEKFEKMIDSIKWCEVCGDGIAPENYERHMKDQHGGVE